jgi:hypothetical protein
LLSDAGKFVWAAVRGLLPYPDVRRRLRMRRAAFKLITCRRWPGDDATGDDAAQLVLLRLLWLQRHVRRAVRRRRREEAALLARSAVDACIVGLYCLHSETAVADLSAANNSAAGRVLGYLTDGDLEISISKSAIDAAVQTLGEKGGDPNLRQWAEWLAKQKEISIAIRLYTACYVPLSHFFAHTNAFTLSRHVGPDDKLRRRPVSPWARRPPVRLADGCAGLLAAAIADKIGSPSAGFLTKYAADHLDRVLVPAFTLAVRGLRRSTQWRKVPSAFAAVRALRRYLNGPGRDDDASQQEARIREGFTTAFGVLGLDQDEMFRVVVDEFVALVLASLNTSGFAQEPPG